MNSDVGGALQKDHAEFAKKYLDEHSFADKWEVTVADNYHLQLDYDEPNILLMQQEPPEQFKKVMDVLNQTQGGRYSYTVMESKGGNTHVIITLRLPLNPHLRVAWQAAFGSDFLREALHLKSLMNNELNPILLFTRKVGV